eukprot:CAMPEP_0204189368 /NCGR_PEP_ID=MMETSP0361-20130328/58432_1 /ASSEMBLY_ACC=CAM_ASM_000343 /TAXON_ID=268821 /ORGANISM="Scrippsiella Hangoei, Strain SHTV-5" /LENGTH=62 /DNA_ID=CAMNT_0051150043 /DNA_START=30 /DNA_END=214 /DNA_ORIENTATION=+
MFSREVSHKGDRISARVFVLYEIGCAVVLILCASRAVEGAWMVASQEVRATMLQGTSSASST